MTHVLLIHQAFVLPDEAGSTRHYELAHYCVTQNMSFTIIASGLSYLSGQSSRAQRTWFTRQSIAGVQVVHAYMYPALHRGFIWRVLAFFSFMFSSVVAALCAGPVDLVMGTSPPLFQALSAWIVAVIRRKPFLLEIRDLWPEFAIDMGVLRHPILIALLRWLEGFLYARATHLLVNSPAYRDYLLARGIPESKISFISNGVDPQMFEPEATGAAIRQQTGLNGHFVVTYAGALGQANDIPTILRAANRLRDESDIHFLLVGDGKERTNLERLVEQLHLSNVTFLGVRPKSEIPDVLACSNACVVTLQDIPMFRTTYPNKVFDYMAAGRPTILAIDGVIRQVVEAANGGIFVPPGDDLRLAEAIRRLYASPSETQTMGHAARAYVVEHFNRQHQARSFAALLQRLIR